MSFVVVPASRDSASVESLYASPYQQERGDMRADEFSEWCKRAGIPVPTNTPLRVVRVVHTKAASALLIEEMAHGTQAEDDTTSGGPRGPDEGRAGTVGGLRPLNADHELRPDAEDEAREWSR